MADIMLIKGDITRVVADAIVNAANNSLLGGGGVDGAIHRAAGPQLSEACRKTGGCPTGEARITPAFNLPARYVIHTVGPVWKGGKYDEEPLLKSCYVNSLSLALKNACTSVAFPNISTGVYGYPKSEAAKSAIETVNAFLRSCPTPLKVIFVCFDEENYTIYEHILADK